MKNIFFLLLLVFAGHGLAQSGGPFQIVRSGIAGGGAVAVTNGPFQVNVTLGEPLGGTGTNAVFSAQSGFWVQQPPLIFGPQQIGNDFVFSFWSDPGAVYQVQFATSLSALNWQYLPSITGDGTAKTVTNAGAGNGVRFFRLFQQ